MIPSTTCVPPAQPLQCTPAAPSVTAPAPVAAAAAWPPSPGPRAASGVTASEDPIALLSEAVDQLRLALVALKRNANGDESQVSTQQKASPSDGRISALAREIGASQNEIGALLASRKFNEPTLPASQFGSPASLAPFGDAAYSDAGDLFAQQTAEPDF